MRALLSREYIPFGTQYYRAPSPPREEWERDLAAIARLGLNTVKFWVQWRWNNPREGVFWFEDIDRLMDIAQANGLRVMLNTIVDVAPAWIYRKYADVSMKTLDGRSVGPQTQPHRQIGGLGVCFNHQAAMEHLYEFIRQTVRRYRGHPALEMWNVASEPELTSSMAELRLYAADAQAMGAMLCYCDNCRRAFLEWLGKKYGSVEALNTSWNRNYQDFRDAELPVTRNSFNDMIDWRMFFVHTIGENVRRRFAVAREEDGGKHPLLCHHVFIQGFPVTSTANDPWNVGQLGELHGITQMDDPMMCDVLRSCARGRPVISAEMLMLFGYTLDLPKPVVLDDIKRYVFTGIAANLKGFIFWQYRPETLAREAPAWGLTFPDGSASPWLRGYAEVNRVIQENAGFLLDAFPRPADVGMLYNPENQIFAWAATGSEKTATDSLLGMHRALYEHNFVIDLIHLREVEPTLLRQYKVLVAPFPYVLGEKICAVLEEWVKEGGVLIGECYFAGWDIERGRHQTTIPGYGMHRIFGARQGIVGPAGSSGTVEITVKKALPGIAKGSKVTGTLVKEALVPDGAEVLATFADGAPAITIASHGKGKAVLIGSYIALPHHRTGYPRNGDLIAGLIDGAAKTSRPYSGRGKRVRVDFLHTKAGRRMVIVRNLHSSSVEASIMVPGLTPGKMREQFSGESLLWVSAGSGAKARVKLKGREVRVYRD